MSHERAAPAEQPTRRISGWAPAVVRDYLVLLLAFVSGCDDAISYVGLGAVFTSNMTGNTVLFGIALARAQFSAALRAGVALAGFMAGIALGAKVLRCSDPSEGVWSARVTRALIAECLFLVVLTICGASLDVAGNRVVVYPLIALSALAMGLQSVAVRSLGVDG